MSTIVVVGAGLGGMSAAYELRETLGNGHAIVLVGEGERFAFTPSNPWLAVGWRQEKDTTLPVAEHVARKGIRYLGSGVARIEAEANRVVTGAGETIDYDYLVICTGPRLAFEEVPGAGPDGGHTESVCTAPHALQAWQRYQQFLQSPGPVVIGAVQGASCFGPAYEFAMIVDADLRKRKLR
ncbi:FAD/NAD(P)-binding oxidoreductase, partial [Dokdonella sp.]